MNIVSKCFECSLDGDHWTNVIANTQGKAKSKFLRELEWDYNDYIHVKCRRNKNGDLIEQEPHSIVKKLSEEQLGKMSHAIGHDYYKDEPYRNYYQTETDEDWEGLIKLKLAEHAISGTGMPFYYLTDLGIDVIRTTVPKRRVWLSRGRTIN